MFKIFLIKLLTVLTILKFSNGFLTNTKQEIIKSLNEELYIKHLNIIKDFDFQIDRGILFFIKKLSQKNIYASAWSVTQMNDILNKDYYTPEIDYLAAHESNNWDKIYKRRSSLVYPPKTLVLVYGENSKEIISYLFTRINEYPVSKFIWLIIDDSNELHENSRPYYIPYNSLFLLLKNSINDRNNYFIEELYHTSIKMFPCFSRLFGFWSKDKGILIPEPDIYKRRFDMNGTSIQAFYHEVGKEYIDECKRPQQRMECQFAYELSQVLNFKLIVDVYDPESPFEIYLHFFALDYFLYYPYFVGPFYREDIYIHIAYDESFKQYGISRLSSPFSSQLWWAIAAWIGISMVFIMIIQYYYDKSNKENLISETFWYYLFEPFESLLSQSGQDPPKKFPFFAVTYSTRIVALFIVPAYTGALLSFILLPSIQLPFTDLKGFAEDGSYRLGYLNDILTPKAYENIVLHSYDENMKKILQLSEPIYDSFGNVLEKAIENLCNDHKFAFLFYEFNLIDDDCTIIHIPSHFISGTIMLKMRYHSPYMKIFYKIFKTMKSSGVFQKMLSDQSTALGFRFNPAVKNFRPSTSQDDDVKISSLMSVFRTTGFFYIISLIVLIAEIIYNRWWIKGKIQGLKGLEGWKFSTALRKINRKLRTLRRMKNNILMDAAASNS